MNVDEEAIQFELINIYIGLSIRFARLEKGFSQLIFANEVDLTNTTIGRIERAEHFSTWDKLLHICTKLDLQFSDLLKTRDKKTILTLLAKCKSLEDKLTLEKEKYYDSCQLRIEKLFLK